MIEGLLQAHPSVITSRDHCCQLLGHEASRVLHDRLTNDADRRYFYQVLSDHLHSGFKGRWSPEDLQKTPLIFGDFLEGNPPHGPRVYRFVRQYDRLPQILEVSLLFLFFHSFSFSFVSFRFVSFSFSFLTFSFLSFSFISFKFSFLSFLSLVSRARKRPGVRFSKAAKCFRPRRAICKIVKSSFLKLLF